jgi:hypothetical protein
MLQEIEPAHAREPEVEQDQIGMLPLEPIQSRFGGEDQIRLMAELLEEVPEDASDRPVIFDDQHPHGRGFQQEEYQRGVGWS